MSLVRSVIVVMRKPVASSASEIAVVMIIAIVMVALRVSPPKASRVMKLLRILI